MNKKLATAAIIMTVCLLFGGCSKTNPGSRDGVIVTDSLEGRDVLVGSIPCEFPLTEDDSPLNILTCSYGSTNPDEVYVWQKYKEMTGVDVNWTSVKRDDRSEAVSLALMNRQSYDLIMRCKISANKLTQYGESGLILDLAKDDLLKNNAPNCWAYLQSHPDTLASVTNPDGAIFSVPQVNSGAELRVSVKMYVNKNWLEKVNMSLPSTTEEFYQLLKAFKENDANGNGVIGDEIPFCIQWASVRDSLYGSFGLGNRGVHNTLVDYDKKTGGVRLIAAADEYRDFLEYTNRLYSEKLLDSYMFTITDEQWKNYVNSDLVGVFASTNLAWLPADKLDNWVAIEEPLEGPNGDKLWYPIRANFHSTGAAVLPATCKNPELVLRWLDYFWTDEGTLFYHMGTEGETFVANEDGTFDYTPEIYEKMKTENKSFDDVVADYSPYPGGSNPTVEIAPYFMGGEMAEVPAAAARALFKYGPEEYWPSFTFTAEENEALESISTDIKKYVDSSTIEFVNGTRPLSDWDAYVAQLEKLKMSDMLSIYQAAVNRFESSK